MSPLWCRRGQCAIHHRRRHHAPSAFIGHLNYDFGRRCRDDVDLSPSIVGKFNLIRERASASRPSGAWKDGDFDVLADGAVVGRIFKVQAAPVGSPWMWTLAFGHHEDRTPTHGYAATRGAAMAAFAKSWRWE
jgi:hypothetical protein